MNYLAKLPPSPYMEILTAEQEKKQKWVNQNKKGFLRYREPFQALSRYKAEYVNCSGETVVIGQEDELSGEDRRAVEEYLKSFMPWRKGPFSVFGTTIDAEWRSEKKWHRLVPKLPELKDKVIADIGCNNGYYMFRMSPYRPRMVVGFEPSVQHYYCFQALRNMAGLDDLYIDLLGVEHIGLLPDTFDVIFLMGVIYHRSSPLDVLKDIHKALKPGGTLLLESQAIPGEAPYALFPEKTYAKAPGNYFIPTGTCLRSWMVRTGFDNVELFCTHPMSESEQRKTAWMTFESFSDYLDPADSSRTIEGYPAPWRVFLTGKKM
ncbi:MAG: tRNA 5-methoxyuridine(34)/uridine 5-oxyacetic acid(34) synthase CmoB [Desulfopila sp.]|jgi:tRNA (mo5U34)-methyltransferase|nr:tRNA 5-methoxyuridine(34)/uridine 5-oxyacetic acid(34) synthase CmoB [Desulfopila sp.]